MAKEVLERAKRIKQKQLFSDVENIKLDIIYLHSTKFTIELNWTVYIIVVSMSSRLLF